MLKHEVSQETPLQTAAQVRVTPEELATALSRIEARKDAGQRHADGTIPIGEAVQQIGIEATPEEVLAEVQALRWEPMRTKKRQPSLGRRLMLALGLGGVLLGVAIDGSGLSQIAESVNTNTPQSISLDPNMMVGDASGKLIMLSEVRDNQPVKCNYGYGSFQQYTPDDTGFAWTLIKHDGQVYIRGLIPRMSEQALQANGADVKISGWDMGGFTVPVTLPLHGFKVIPKEDSNIEFHAYYIHLDQHANEKWKP